MGMMNFNCLVDAALGDYSSKMISGWSPPDGYDQVAVSCLVPDHPNVWSGMSVAGVRLILFTLLVISRLVGVSALFLGLFNLFKELSYGESFWLYSLLVLFI